MIRILQCERVSIVHLFPWAYDVRGTGEWLPWCVWIYSTGHDSWSYFWRILGFEINVPTARARESLRVTRDDDVDIN